MLYMRIFKIHRSNLFFTRKVQKIRKKTIDQKKNVTKKTKNKKTKIIRLQSKTIISKIKFRISN